MFTHDEIEKAFINQSSIQCECVHAVHAIQISPLQGCLKYELCKMKIIQTKVVPVVINKTVQHLLYVCEKSVKIWKILNNGLEELALRIIDTNHIQKRLSWGKVQID